VRVNGRLLLSGDQVDLWVVHRGGFIIDLLAGFVLSCRSTRVVGAVVVTAFHLMNSCMFDIGASVSLIGNESVRKVILNDKDFAFDHTG